MFPDHLTSDIPVISPLTRMFPVSISRDSYCTCMCHGDPPGPFPLSVVPVGYDDSSLSRTSLRPYVCLSTRLLPVPGLLTPSLLSNFLLLPDWTLFLLCMFTALRLFVLVSLDTCIYTGLEMGRSPSSIYFATTLVL